MRAVVPNSGWRSAVAGEDGSGLERTAPSRSSGSGRTFPPQVRRQTARQGRLGHPGDHGTGTLGIQCLGYIEEAMSELIPGAKRRFADHMDDWEHALPALSKRVGNLEKQVTALRKAASVEKAARVQLEVKVASQEPEACEVVVENRRFL